MQQSIKVDVIYYATSTDFEMEFNLGGCCRMRLLADKAADRRGLVQQLARAVSRSRVILCCGPLFGESGLIETVASAIGRQLKTAENETYGIQGDQSVSIIDGSTPLVTEDGVFGGCVIESGPQSIILLTESKSVRKNLMGTLIHPYIEGLSKKEIRTATKPEPTENETEAEAVEETVAETDQTPAEQPAENEPTAEEVTEEAAPETTEPDVAEEVTEAEEIAEAEESSSEEVGNPEESKEDESSDGLEITFVEGVSSSEDQTDAESTQEAVSENAEAEKPSENNEQAEEDFETKTDETLMPDQPEKGFELFIEPEDVVFNHKKYYEMYYEAEESLVGVIPRDDEVKRPFGRRILLIIGIVLILCLLVLGYLFVFVPLNRGIPIPQYFKDVFTSCVSVHRLL